MAELMWSYAVAKYGHERIEEEARACYDSYARTVPQFTEWPNLTIPQQTGWLRVAVDVLERHG
jgi:hypothetical protein